MMYAIFLDYLFSQKLKLDALLVKFLKKEKGIEKQITPLIQILIRQVRIICIVARCMEMFPESRMAWIF